MQRSSGVFPRYATWVDKETILSTTAKKVPNLKHSKTVTFVVFVEEAAARATGTATNVALPTAKIQYKSGTDYKDLLTIPTEKVGRHVFVRSGYELGDMTELKITESTAATGTTKAKYQVSFF